MEAKSLQQLAAWGYGSLVARESLRDQLLNGRPALTPEQQEQAVPLFLAFHKLTTQAAVQRWLLAEGLTEDDLHRRAERQLRWQLLCEQRFRSQVSTLFLKSLLEMATPATPSPFRSVLNSNSRVLSSAELRVRSVLSCPLISKLNWVTVPVVFLVSSE